MILIGPLGRPAPDATASQLREHFVLTNTHFALLVYEDAIHTCLVCGLLGENKCGKANSPSGRNRFCSDECEAVFNANVARMKPVALLEEETRGRKKARRVQVDDEGPEVGEGEERSAGDARSEP